jgi:hypothetical protein
MNTLSSDILQYLFTSMKLRLRCIINLTMVSKKIRQISLLEENWYVISDSYKMLWIFVNKTLQWKSRFDVSYPLDKIKMMISDTHYLNNPIGIINLTQHRDVFNFNEINYPETIIIPPRLICWRHFCEFFSNYQYFFMSENDDRLWKSFRGLCAPSMSTSAFNDKILHQKITNRCNITEIIASDCIFDCKILAKYLPGLEKLEARAMYNTQYLVRTKLQHLHIAGNNNVCGSIVYLPDTIKVLESNEWKNSSLFELIKKLRHLHYLKINLSLHEISTTQDINTVVFIIPNVNNDDIRIDIPNIRNIIIVPVYAKCRLRKLYLSSQNAITCQILNIDIDELLLNLPNCSEVIQHCRSIIRCNSDVYYHHQEKLLEWVRGND